MKNKQLTLAGKDAINGGSLPRGNVSKRGMSSAPAASPIKAYPIERRSHERFPINLKADFRVIYRNRILGLGATRTLNIGSGGVLLKPDQLLAVGASLELLISWPLRLEGGCRLKLVILGRIVRSDAGGAAVKAKHYEFRTSGIRTPGTIQAELQVRSLSG